MESPPSPIVTEAQRLRNLGRYPEAERKFREALAESDSLVLRTELASMFMEQGCVRKCRDELIDARAQFPDDSAGSLASALADMLFCSAEAGTSLQFTAHIERAAELYKSQLMDLPVEGYNRKHVSNRWR